MNILLIDLSSIAHPLWHVSASDPNPNATSIATVARVRALASGQPHVAVCCDAGRSFRKDISPDYKANRPATDGTLIHQIVLAVEMLKADGFPVWSIDGFEADDLIATATKSALVLADDDATIQIASADKDLLQLVTPRVSIKSLKDGSIIDAEAVKAKFGIAPEQVRDYLALVGDKSDNIAGAKGIGAKKAVELLMKFGNLDDLYAALDGGETLTPALLDSLDDFRVRMPTVRELITLRFDAPLPFSEIFEPRVTKEDAVGELAFAQESPELAVEEPTARVATPYQQLNADLGSGQPRAVSVIAAPAPTEWERHLEPRSMSEAKALAGDLFASRLFSAYGNAPAVLSTILAGREIGMTAMASLRAFHIIDGKPTLAADTIRAMVMRSPLCESFRCTERTATKATFCTKRRGQSEFTMTFTIEEGRAAFVGDDKKWLASGWGKNPADMCVARCSAKLARLVYPDVVHGFYSPEEF